MNYFTNEIINEELEATTEINIIIFMLKKIVKTFYCEFNLKLKQILIKVLYSKNKHISVLGNILSEYVFK